MSEDHEAECATCYHGVSMHTGEPFDACTVPGCDCKEFVDVEEE